MNNDIRRSDPLLNPELIEEHLRRGRQLRSEVMARAIGRLFAKMRGGSRRMSGPLRSGAGSVSRARCGACA